MSWLRMPRGRSVCWEICHENVHMPDGTTGQCTVDDCEKDVNLDIGRQSVDTCLGLNMGTIFVIEQAPG